MTYDELMAALGERRERMVVDGEGADLSMAAKPGCEVCDFCSAPDPHHDVRARDFRMPDLVPDPTGLWSRGDWAACDACWALVSAGHWEALVDRVVAIRTPGWAPAPLPMLREYVEATYAALRAHLIREP